MVVLLELRLPHLVHASQPLSVINVMSEIFRFTK